MIDPIQSPDHHVQRHILSMLRRNEQVRFRDLRPGAVDSNVFTYHLKKLVDRGFIVKLSNGYTLTIKGIAYIDQVSTLDTRPRRQPKIMTIIALINEVGEVLVRRKANQPMINQWTLPCGILHMEDLSIKDAAIREIQEKLGIQVSALQHVGDCYMAIRYKGAVIMNALMHTFTMPIDKSSISLASDMCWKRPDDLADAAPATRNIMRTLQTHRPGSRFFEEYVEEHY